jgi:hypothetical protein
MFDFNAQERRFTAETPSAPRKAFGLVEYGETAFTRPCLSTAAGAPAPHLLGRELLGQDIGERGFGADWDGSSVIFRTRA